MLQKNKDQDQEWMKHWRAWASWYSWGSPVGLGILLVSVGLMVWLLSLAGLI